MQQTTGTIEYLSVEELEAYTGISASTWNRRRVTGDTPPFCKIGRLVKYRRGDVDQWLVGQRIQSTSEPVPAPKRGTRK